VILGRHAACGGHIGTPTLIFFGWLSDHIGRYYPLYSWLGSVTQPGQINMPIAILIIAILVAYVGMVYGPIGAFLAEYFPAKIRYTSVSCDICRLPEGDLAKVLRDAGQALDQ
jgi:hypothetical protein